MTELGEGKIIDVNVLKRRVNVELDSGGAAIMSADKVKKIQPPNQQSGANGQGRSGVPKKRSHNRRNRNGK